MVVSLVEWNHIPRVVPSLQWSRLLQYFALLQPRLACQLSCPALCRVSHDMALRVRVVPYGQSSRLILSVIVMSLYLPRPCPALARRLPGPCPALSQPLPLPAAARATLARSLDILGRLPGSLVIPVSGSSPDRNLCSKPNAGCACCYHADCHTRFSGES